MPCSTPGPAVTVNVPIWQEPQPTPTPTPQPTPTPTPTPTPIGQPPGQPGAPYKVSQTCKSNQKADVTIAWSGASGATSYRVYHISGALHGTSNVPQFTVKDVDAKWDGYFTVYIEACNDAGCTRGPSAQIQVKKCVATCPTPPSPTVIRDYFQALGCTVQYVAGKPEKVIVYYGGKSYTFTVGSNCYYSGTRIVCSASEALKAARYLGACT